MKKATFGAGCFWCVETVFAQLKGVESVLPGYSGGETQNPSYKEICTGKTGHAEVVQVEYNENEIEYDQLLDVFFHVHDPTTLNRQGNDMGTQYRSAIFFHDEQQKELAEGFIEKLHQQHAFSDPIVTTLEPFDVFYPAEQEHLNYYRRNPDQAYCSVVIRPKVEKFQQRYKDLIE